MFYRGRIHEVAAEPRPATWLDLLVAAQEINAGLRVVFLDFEDDEGGIVGWLLAMGARPGAIREYFAYL